MRRNRNHVLRLGVNHQRGHALRMDVTNVAVGLQYQLAAVAVPLPARDGLHVDAALDRCRDEHPAQTAMRVDRQIQPLARFGDRFARLLDVEQFFAGLPAIAEFPTSARAHG